MQSDITAAISNAVFIITARDGDIINGMTAAWVTQVSFKPPMIGVAIAEARYTHELIKKSGFFCINALSKNSMELAKRFGFKSGRKVNKFDGVEYTSALKGSPVIKEAFAYLECSLSSICKTGDHDFMVGTVEDIGIQDKDAEPLIFKWNDFFGKRTN